MTKGNDAFIEKWLMQLTDLSIEILAKTGRTEFFYFLSEKDIKESAGRQRITSNMVDNFVNHFARHRVKVNYLPQYKSFQITLDLIKCVLDVYRFSAVTNALKS